MGLPSSQGKTSGFMEATEAGIKRCNSEKGVFDNLIDKKWGYPAREQ
jgi:hypothetical protein